MLLQEVKFEKNIFLGLFPYLTLAITTSSVWSKNIQSSSSCDPYRNYSCLYSYLGEDFITRFFSLL
ncbi:Uncharacterised protein [Legionella sainthelensi]|nr:Uncharacterised protein [Legionella sainthelensi]